MPLHWNNQVKWNLFWFLYDSKTHNQNYNWQGFDNPGRSPLNNLAEKHPRASTGVQFDRGVLPLWYTKQSRCSLRSTLLVQTVHVYERCSTLLISEGYAPIVHLWELYTGVLLIVHIDSTCITGVVHLGRCVHLGSLWVSFRKKKKKINKNKNKFSHPVRTT